MQNTMKKDFDMEKALGEAAEAPAGGVTKKSPNKVAPSTPKKAKGTPGKGRKKGSPVKSEAFVAKEDDEDADIEGGEVKPTEGKEEEEEFEV